MEFEVMAIGGIDNCFASLPLSLIQTLQSTNGGFLPPLLALQLRSSSGASWTLAWSGSASNSPAIEIDQRLAECISLPNGSRVQLKVIGNLSKASVVNIEPNGEDDWEILELNSEAAEEVILKQVGIVFEGMKFPLWLHGHIVVEFIVVSTSPNQPVVQLVPGTKVAVAPKTRKNRVDACKDIQRLSSIDENTGTKAKLRVQASKKYVHRFIFSGLELGVVLTSVAYLHPETAKRLSFDNLQLVIIEPRLPPFEAVDNVKDTSQRKGGNSANSVANNGDSSSSRGRARHTIVQILYSDTVVKGHVMLPLSIRLFLRACIHSWVYISKYCNNPVKDVPLLTLSPCRFKLAGKNNSTSKDGFNVLENNQNFKGKSAFNVPGSSTNKDVADWGQHEKFLESLFDKVCHEGDKGIPRHDTTWCHKFLIQSWFLGQLKEFASQTSQMEATSITLPKETILHFEITYHDPCSKSMERFSDGQLLMEGGKSTFELLYLLVATFDDSCNDELKQSYEFSLNAGNKDVHGINNLELVPEKLEFGDAIVLDSVVEGGLNRKLNLTLSSLSWMEKAATDIVNRLFVLLSPSSLKLLNTLTLPLPGHVLIHGPSGSGKSTLAMAIARHLEEHEEILAHVCMINSSIAEYTFPVQNLPLRRVRQFVKQLQIMYLKLLFILLPLSFLMISTILFHLRQIMRKLRLPLPSLPWQIFS